MSDILKEYDVFRIAFGIDSPDLRAEYLQQVGAYDPEISKRVELLLQTVSEEPEFLERPVGGECPTLSLPSRPVGVGVSVGPYELREQLAEGGMGVVYVAEQTKPVRRKVALKVIKPGLSFKDVIARFDAERQALALMDHPHIARVIDGGETESGQPYFVMELVPGLPLTEYCASHKLTIRQRLELFIDVCHAVQHAHQKGIIHRDLKPSNIMVTMADHKAVVKVIDFGIAKALHHDLTDKTVYTSYGQMVGTPMYMSPEQALLSSIDVDTRSDIYSLGVLLYELLTGTTPFDKETFKKVGFDEVRRMIREVEPRRPSEQISTLKAEQVSTISNIRATDHRLLSKTLRGDLDWIVMKAIEKDRNRRYETANDLATDVQRFLDLDPVNARPPTAMYRLRKFARRNRVSLAFASVTGLFLVSGAIGLAVSNHLLKQQGQETLAALRSSDENFKRAQENLDLAEENERQARTDAAIAEEVNNFINKLIGKAHPDDEPNRDLKVSDFLDRALVEIEGRFDEQPLVEAHIRSTIANALYGLGRWKDQVRVLEVARRIYQQELGPFHRDTLACEVSLISSVAHQNGRFSNALDRLEPLTRRSLEEYGFEDRLTLRMEALCAEFKSHIGRFQDAELQLRKILEIQTRVFGRDDPDTLSSLRNLAGSLDGQGRYAAAEGLYRELLDSQSKQPDTVAMHAAKGGLVRVIAHQGRFAEAEKLLRENIEDQKEHLGVDHTITLHSMDNLANLLNDCRRYADAESLSRKVLELRQGSDPAHRHAWRTKSALAAALRGQQLPEQAEKIIRDVVEERKRAMGPRHESTLSSLKILADALNDLAKYDEASSIYRDLIAALKQEMRPNHPVTLDVINNLAVSYWLQDRLDEALPLFEEVVEGYKAEIGDDHPVTLTLIANLGVNYKDAGRLEEAIACLRQAIEARGKYPQLYVFSHQLIDAYVKVDRMNEAKEEAEEHLNWIRDNLPESSAQLSTQLKLLCLYYFMPTQSYRESEKLLRECLSIQEEVMPDRWQTYNTQLILGEVLCDLEEFAEADEMLQNGYRGLVTHKSSIPPKGKSLIADRFLGLAEFYESMGNDAKAIKWRERIEEFKSEETVEKAKK